MTEKPQPHDYMKVVNGEGDDTPVFVSWPSGVELNELLDINVSGAHCTGISKGLAIFSCNFSSLDELSKRLTVLIEKWISDSSVCGGTCKAAKHMALVMDMEMTCADCDRVYNKEGFRFRKWEKIK